MSDKLDLYLNLQNFRRTEEGVEPCLFQVDLPQVDKLQDGLQVGKTDIARGKMINGGL